MWLLKKKKKARRIDPGFAICLKCGKGSLLLLEKGKHPNLNQARCVHCGKRGTLAY